MTGYAIFNPDRHSTKPASHPVYGTCEALYPNLKREEAMERLAKFREVNADKKYTLREWPQGRLVQ